MAFVPLQPSDAVQLVAFVELHVSVDALPLATAVGLAARVTVGGGDALTLTMTLRLLLPPVPEQVNVKVVLVVSSGVLAVPLVGVAPLQPPEAVQLVAFVELQVNVDAVPLTTLVGLALSATVGLGTTVTRAVWLALPAPFEQLSV
jgi:hypothetical protein